MGNELIYVGDLIYAEPSGSERNFVNLAQSCYNYALNDQSFEYQLDELGKFPLENIVTFYQGLMRRLHRNIESEEFEDAKKTNDLATKLYLRQLG